MASKVAFNALRKLSPKKRVDAVSNPDGSAILSTLTPTDFALLFPRYYQRGLPDVSGFRAAISKATQQQQQSFTQKIEEKLAEIEKTVSGYGKAAKSKINAAIDTITGRKSVAQLSPEADAAFQKIQSGPVGLNSDEGKIFSKLSDSQLSGLGISKSKDNTGRDVYQYTAPEVGVEEAKSRMKTAGSGSNKFFDSIIRAEGTGKYGDPYNTSLGYMKSPKPLTDMTMREALDWGEQVKKAQGLNSSAKGAFQIVNTTQLDAMRALGIGMDEKFSPENQRRMASWIAKKQGLGAWEGFKLHPNEREIASGAMKEGLDKQFTSEIKPQGPNGEYSEDQINQMMGQMRQEKDAARKQQLANLLQDAGVDTATVNKGTEKLNEINSYKSAGKGYCGIGTRLAARDLFGDRYFNQGLGSGGSAQASSLSRDNNYFQNSGYYNAKKTISKEQALDPNYLNNLPIGTVISAQGGNANGDGHVQIKLGPNRWASYFDQNGVLGERRDGRQYNGYSVHIPNENGLNKIQQNGYATNVAAAPAPTQRTVEDSIDVNHTDKNADITLEDTNSKNIEKEKEKAKVEAKQTVNFDPTKPAPDGTYWQQYGDNKILMDKQTGAAVHQLEGTKRYNDIVAESKKDTAPTTQAPTATVEKPAEKHVEKPKQLSKSFRVSPEAFKEASVPEGVKRGYPEMLVRMADPNEFKKGFNESKEAKEAGAYIDDNWNMKVKNADDPKVKELLEQYKGNVLTEIKDKQAAVETKQQTATVGEKLQRELGVSSAQAGELTPEIRAKVEEQKKMKEQGPPAPTTPTPAPGATTPTPAATTPAATTPSATPAAAPVTPPAAAAPATPPPAPNPTPDKATPSHAGGGKEKVQGTMQMKPISPIRGDDTLVTDSAGKQFTMNRKKETAVVNPNSNMVDIKQNSQIRQEQARVMATQKAVPTPAAPNPMNNEIQTMKNQMGEMNTRIQDFGQKKEPTKQNVTTVADRMGQDLLNNKLQAGEKPYFNPTFHRAMSRAKSGVETGDGIDGNHYSFGTKSI